METVASTDGRAGDGVPKSGFEEEKSSQNKMNENDGSHDKLSSPVVNGKPENSGKDDSFSLHAMAVSPQESSLDKKSERQSPAEKLAEADATSKVQDAATDRTGLSENEGGAVDSTEREFIGGPASITEQEPRDVRDEKTVHFAKTEEIQPRGDSLNEEKSEGTTSAPLQEKTPEMSAAGSSKADAANPNLVSPLPKAKTSVLNRVPTIRSSEEQLKYKIVIPSYLSEGMVKAIQSAGAGETDQSQDSRIERGTAPECPILVFINSKSGGRLGPQLESLLVDLLAPSQVYDLSKCVPVDVLAHGLGHLEERADAGDKTALQTRNNLRILVAGGDGTIGWVLGTIGKVESKSHFTVPPVAVIPLGTGNDFSRSFRWGGSTTSISRKRVKKCLRRVVEAEPANVDSWQVIVKPAPTQLEKPLKLPHAMAPQHHIPRGDSGDNGHDPKSSPSFKGYFWNYFSLGMDAQITYGFHNLRDEAPWLAHGRVSNQMVYGGYSCVQGWFCTPCAAAPVARGLRHILKMEIKKSRNAQWEELVVPPNIRGIVILNLQSYAGGRHIWGRPSSSTRETQGLLEAKYDDGMLEMIGLRGGWHTTVVFLEWLAPYRLGQAHAVRLKFTGVHSRSMAYMQMDGEPWVQHLGLEEEPPAVVELSCNPIQSRVLVRR